MVGLNSLNAPIKSFTLNLNGKESVGYIDHLKPAYPPRIIKIDTTSDT